MPATASNKAGIHRELTLGDSGADIVAVQQSAALRCHRHGLSKYVTPADGDFGPKSLVMCEKAIWALGALKATVTRTTTDHTLSIGGQQLIRKPDQYRTATNLTIARARTHELLTHEHAKAVAKVHISGNKVTGGTAVERLVAAAQHSMFLWETGKVHRYYSMGGSWDVDHAITGPDPGRRDDCSSWFIGIYKACGLPDPAGTNYQYGNTETLWDHGHEIDESQADGGDGVIYGKTAGSSHHVEFLWKPPVTIGHGDAAVNRGRSHEMGDAHFFRFAH